MEELDTESALEELSKTSTASPAALLLKIEGILPDLSRHCSITQLQPVNDTLCQCWREGAVLPDLQHASIFNLSKRATGANVTITQKKMHKLTELGQNDTVG